MRPHRNIQIPRSFVESALLAITNDRQGVLLDASEEQRQGGIDYVFRLSDGREITIDLKVRQRNHQKLAVEVDVLNNDRRRPWLYSSKADYFLFAHYDPHEEIGDFYLVKRKHLLKLVKTKKYRDRYAFVYEDYEVSVLYFYEYSDLNEVANVIDGVIAFPSAKVYKPKEDEQIVYRSQ